MSLDRPSIVAKAFEVLDQQGVAGLSTRKLADALGVSGPSLYWHFKTKRELFDFMTEAMLDKALAGLVNPASDFDWVQWLADGARSIRREILSHPDGAVVFVGYRPTREMRAKGPPPWALLLSRIGLDPRESLLILRIMGRFVVGWTLDEQAAGPANDAEDSFDFALSVMTRGAQSMVGELLAAKTAKAG